MRASKESAECARQRFAGIVEILELQYDKGGRLPPVVESAVNEVAEFLNVAKRKLPTEAAYERDRKRKRA